MKRAKSPNRRSAAAAGGAPKTVDEYLAGIPQAARGNFDRLRAAIRAALPGDAVETISYRIPAFKRDRILVWYAAFANHCSLFPTSSVIAAFTEELKGLSTSKGTVHFPNDRPIPIALVKRLVKARLKESGSKKVG